jgi:formate dehydrogenase major subunit
VANTWGYGAMTNSYNDIRNSKTLMIMGGNPAEAHPVSLQHLLEARSSTARTSFRRSALTRTAAHATEYVRVRPGHPHPDDLRDALAHLQNGWEDKEFISSASTAWTSVRKEVEKWTPDEVERVTGLPEAQLKRVAEKFAKERPSTLIWAMGQTQFTVGTANVRASCIALLATGNVGGFGNGANIFRGHCNVQGATDLGLDIGNLPLYYGWSKAPGSTGAGSGRSTTTDAVAVRTPSSRWKRRHSVGRAGSTRPCCRRTRSRRRTI